MEFKIYGGGRTSEGTTRGFDLRPQNRKSIGYRKLSETKLLKTEVNSSIIPVYSQ